jgi:predicted dienelactone hydrolase
VRVADMQLALDQLAALNEAAQPGAGRDPLAGRLDLSRVGALGHSLGGITAAQTCLADARLRACANLDGLQPGGPFAVEANPTLPSQPFLFLTKETQLSGPVTAWMEALRGGGYYVTVQGATHASFSDEPVLLAALLPLPNRADDILGQVRRYTRAFFDQTLRGEPSALLAPADWHDGVRVTVYTGS